jgi:hypothetical protein
MSTTFNFEELDDATREYLVAVRDGEGSRSPGVFVSTSDALPGCGLLAGPLVVIGTLLATLTSWIDVVYDDPIRVAMLQTAGLVAGGWLFLAWFRLGKSPNWYAGAWAYVDPLHLYEAYRETITITPLDDVVEAHFTHNYNNGNYQNSVVRISMGNNRVTTVTLSNEARAEQMVVYLNYVAWAQGPESKHGNLSAAKLGGVARYVARNDHEPLDAQGELSFDMIELDITNVPEEPQREGRSVPPVVPYLVMVLAAAVLFVFFAFVVNPPMRDDAIFDLVTRETTPPSVEPRFLRAYLVDPRNTMHRDEVYQLLARFYKDPIDHVRQKGTDRDLRAGMAKILESVSRAEQPVVSVRVTEQNTPVGKESTRTNRESDLRTQFVSKLNDELSKPLWGQAIKPPPGEEFTEQPPPIGQQLLAFVEAPADAKGAHFDITYIIDPAEFGQFRLAVQVDLRTSVEENPVATSRFDVPTPFDAAALAGEVIKLKEELVLRLVGITNNPGPGQQFAQPGVGP